MPISMERFESNGLFATYDPFADSVHRVAVFSLQCRKCGYEPEDSVAAPKICPKCFGESFERFVRPGSILENASRYH